MYNITQQHPHAINHVALQSTASFRNTRACPALSTGNTPCSACPHTTWGSRCPQETRVAKEALAFEAGLARGILAGSSAQLERRHLGLVDNQGVVACLTRGRSRNGRVNGVIRRLAAVGLVTGSSFDIVWVPTTLPPADELSRSF